MAKALGSAQTPSNIQTSTKKEWDKGILALMEQAEKNKNAPATTATNIPTAQKTEESYAQKQQQLLSDQYAAQERKRIAALKAQREQTLASLESAKTGVEQQYQTGKAATAGTSALQARNLAEYLAQRGQTQSGLAAAGEMARQASLTSALGGLEQARATSLSDIDLQKAQAESAYGQGLTDVESETQIAKLQAMQQAAQQARAEEIANVGQYYDDYQQRINYLESIGDPQGLIPALKIARQQKRSAIAESQAEAEALAAKQQQQEFENWLAMQKLNISRKKASSGGSSRTSISKTGTSENYSNKTDAYNAEYANVLQGQVSPSTIESNQDALVRAYGIGKYNALLKVAKETYKTPVTLSGMPQNWWER